MASWGMSVGNDPHLASISASSTDLKRIQTAHNLPSDFGAGQGRQAAESRFGSKFKPLPVICQSLLKAVPEDNRRFWLQNQCGELLGPRASTSLATWRASSNRGRSRVGGSRCRPQLAAALKRFTNQSRAQCSFLGSIFRSLIGQK